MLSKSTLLVATSLAASLAVIAPAQAKSKMPTNAQLLERIEALESELAKQKESTKSTRAKVVSLEAKAKDVSWDFKDSRPKIKSGDGRFSLAFRARFQFDYAHHMQSDGSTKGSGFVGDLGSGTNIRRAYFGIEGQAFKDFWYELRFDAGDSSDGSAVALNRARVAYHGIPHFRVNVGVIQPMMNYADTVSSGDLVFIERGAISNVTVDNFGGSGHRKGVEFTFQKESFFYGGDNLILNAAYTGGRTGESPVGHGNGEDEMSNVVGRVAYRFYSDSDTNLQIGGGFGRVLNRHDHAIQLRDRPEMRVSGTRLVDTGTITGVDSSTTWSADAQFQWRNFFLAGEYSSYEIDRSTGTDPEFSGWYVEGSWVLTGQNKRYEASSKSNNYGSFKSPKVVTPFSLAGNSWGVWELAARYSVLDLNDISAGIAGGEQRIVGIGLNWYLNNNVKLQINDLIVNVDRSSSAALANNLRGQNLNIIGARLQFSM